MFTDVNFVAVIVATIVGMIPGFLWYSPALFGKQWMAEMGKTPEQFEAEKKNMNMGKVYAIGALLTLITAYALAVLILKLGIVDISGGIKIALLVWFGFMATLQYQDVLYAGGSNKLFLINSGYSFISTLLMAIVLTLWQ